MTVRHWVVRRARFFEWVYQWFEPLFVAFNPLWRALGYDRVEKPIRWVERHLKGALFDCQMCGQCMLSSSGMACPMNCPKQLRNGPCGGVRENGHCEVKPEMRCVWVEAWEGSQRMQSRVLIHDVQAPVDHRLRQQSSWLQVASQQHHAKLIASSAVSK